MKKKKITVDNLITESQAKGSIKEQENDLFHRWFYEYYYNLFGWDGLHHTGTPVFQQNGCWTIKPDGKEEALWYSSLIRLVLLTKDYNSGKEYENVDCRCDTGLKNFVEKHTTNNYFYPVLLKLVYGFLEINPKTGEHPSYEEASRDEDRLLRYYWQAPFVRINTKKMAGGNKCPVEVLRAFIKQDWDYINQQIDIYNGNVFVCCFGKDWYPEKEDSNPIMNILNKRFPDLQPWRSESGNTWIYYSSAHHSVVVHGYHPSAQGMTEEACYKVVSELASFLKAHPDFLKKKS